MSIAFRPSQRAEERPAAPVAQERAGEDAAPASGARAARLTSLDAWRGLTVLLMLLVNNVVAPTAPDQLTHADWGAGLTLTDLVFPWFLFCAGAALPFSLAAARRSGTTGWALVGKLAHRTVLLYLIGAFLTSVETGSFTLGLGVIQLIALASFVGGLLSLLPNLWRLVIAGALLVGYGLFLRYFPIAGAAAGTFEETVNAARQVTAQYLQPLGLRGLLSVIPASALVLLGSVVAQPLKDRSPRAPWLLLAFGAAFALIGWLWATGAGGHFAGLEYNKTYWTPSYVIYAAGLGTLGMLVFWLIADRPGTRFARVLAPLTIPGRNALVAYGLPILFKIWVLQGWNVTWTGKSMPMQDALVGLARGAFGADWGYWVFTAAYILAAWLVLAYMARRHWILKL